MFSSVKKVNCPSSLCGAALNIRKKLNLTLCAMVCLISVERGQVLTKLGPSFVLTTFRGNALRNCEREDNLIFNDYIKLVIFRCLA